ncbi:MAG TPA: NAD(P)-dependent alcohol dehydrogenase [Phycisphaerales bacterium]|nr:NAD(P)-dependent alcohol dehydrogenase [Phycisphaerales bacterium]
MTIVHAYAATEPKGELRPFEFTLGAIGPDEVDIAVDSCGLCHSDLSMLNNEWGLTKFPFVPGHEVVGKVAALGPQVKHLQVGQWVGVGWYSRSCLHCRQCMSGDHNLCPTAEGTIVGRFGGFADRVRAQAAWVSPLPQGVAIDRAGPLFCGGITVFNPLVQLDIKPTDRVGVIGIGGLGHLALQFLNKWGCEVVAFSSSPGKEPELKKLGAHRVVNSRDEKALQALAGTLDAVISTVNVDLKWDAYINALAPRGRLHTVGVVPSPIPAPAFPLIAGQKSVSGSPLGSPATTARMLDFCARHAIAPVTETFPMSKVNEALKHLHEGKARYRIVLKAGV